MLIKKLLHTFLFIFLFFSICAAQQAANRSKSSSVSYDEWLGIYFKGNKMGFVHSVTEEDDTEYRMRVTSYIKAESFGAVQEISIAQESSMSKALRTKGFTLIQEMSGRKQKITGTVSGNTMTVETVSSGAVSSRKIPFTDNTYLSSDVILMVIKKGLKTGKIYNVDIFMEPLQQTVPAEISITGKEKIVFKGRLVDTFIIEQKIQGLSSTMWITPKGDTIKEVSFEGFEFRKEDRESALKFKDGAVPVSSFVSAGLIRTDLNIQDPSSLRHLEIQVDIHGNNLPPEDHRQTITEKKRIDRKGDGSYLLHMNIRSEETENKTHPLLPVKRIDNDPFLGEDHTIQTSHPEIIATAKKIIGGEPDSWEAAKKINTWVYSNMKKKPVDTFSALEALHVLEGECQSHTYLFAALARSAGIPTKVVSGIVYSVYYKGFLYHAWPEIYVGEWRAMDPTLGQHTADATHLKLAEGDMVNQLDLLKFIGRLRITIK